MRTVLAGLGNLAIHRISFFAADTPHRLDFLERLALDTPHLIGFSAQMIFGYFV